MDFTKTTLTYPAGSDIPIRRVAIDHAPTSSNIKNFILGDEWLDTSSDDWWKLCSNSGGSAIWVRIGGTASQVETLTGNSGGVVSPTVSNNLNTLGSGSITIVGSPGTNTTTTQLTGLTNHAVLVGAGSDTITKLGIGTTGQVLIGATAADPAFGALGVNSGLTAHGVVIGEGNSAFAATAAGSTGQLLVSSTGADPAFASIADGSFIFRNSTASTARSVEIQNNSATAGSNSILSLNATTGGGNTVLQWGIIGGNAFQMGQVQSSSGSLKIYYGTLGSGTLVSELTSLGVQSFPAAGFTQFAPLVAGASGIVASIAGAGATGTVLTGVTGANPVFSATPTLTSVTFGSGTVLNTYQQGTFIPALTFGGSGTGITYSLQSGEYTQIGNIVYIKINITLTSKGAQTGTAAIGGFPIAASGENDINIDYYGALTLTANYQNVILQLNTSGTGGSLYQTGSAQTAVVLADTAFANNTIMGFNGFYFIS